MWPELQIADVIRSGYISWQILSQSIWSSQYGLRADCAPGAAIASRTPKLSVQVMAAAMRLCREWNGASGDLLWERCPPAAAGAEPLRRILRCSLHWRMQVYAASFLVR